MHESNNSHIPDKTSQLLIYSWNSDTFGDQRSGQGAKLGKVCGEKNNSFKLHPLALMSKSSRLDTM
jgi:hypothetical protein